MCGITGWIDWRRDLSGQGEILAAMMQTLAARGPDGQGVYIRQHAALGHRRLSVVDPAGGAQPMVRYRGALPFVVTYNGELYNTDELRQELEARGYSFTTHCDTEVLLVAYMEWGPQCVERFNGIFAFGIWDEGAQSLFMARDRIGVKPLFYAEKDGNFLFASEMKALLAHPAMEAIIDREGLAEVFMLGPARTPGNGVFRHIAELKPGHSLLYNRQGKRISQYWRLESKLHQDDFAKTLTTVRELLQDTVRRQLVSDVPVCTLLSGGLDSSLLTALAAECYKRENRGDLHTYSVNYVDNEQYFQANAFETNSDAPWVKKVSEYLGVIHHEVLLDSPELAGALPAAAIARDLPGMADVDTSLYLFCREIKKGATVALSGECADEVFGGYPWFYREEMINSSAFPWSPRPEIRKEWLSPAVRRAIPLEEYVRQRYQDALAEVPVLPGEEARAARMREIFYLSLTRFMPTLLDRKDRMSMAFGLEVRVPYCDHRLVEYVWNVPWSLKNWQNREKGLLRQAMTGVLPDDVLWRRKSPYPKTHHPAYELAVRNRVMTILEEGTSPLLDLVDVNYLRGLASVKGNSAGVPWFGQLMGTPQLFAFLIQTDAWLREFRVKIEV